MGISDEHTKPDKEKKRFGCLQILGITFIILLIMALAVGIWTKYNVYASPFKPVQLNAEEQQVLEVKLEKLEDSATEPPPPDEGPAGDTDQTLEPEPYREDDSKREISLTERELNSLIAKDPDTARRVALDLSEDMVSLKLLIPMDKDVPLLGGKTLRLNVGMNLSFEHGKPNVTMRGISLGGIPLPSAWWGDIKNKNLVEEFSGEGGFWDMFSRGVENIKIREGHLWIKLKE